MKYVIEYSLNYFFNKTEPIEANSLEELMIIFRKTLKNLGIKSENDLDTINIQIVNSCDFCKNKKNEYISESINLSLEEKELIVDVYSGYSDFTDGGFIEIKYCPFCGRKL